MVSSKIVPEDVVASLENVIVADKAEVIEKGPAKKVVTFDDILLNNLGSFGRYQLIQFLLVCIPSIFVAMHVMSWTFVKEPPNLICHANSTECMQPDGEYSAVVRWEMTGDRAWIKAMVQSLYYFGQMTGSFFCGVMGDKIGRKKVFYLALVIQMTCGLLLVVAPTWWIFAILKAGTGFSQPGIFGVAIVLGMELVGPEYRSLGAVATGVFNALGEVILAVIAYFIHDYRLLHLAIAFPSLIFLSYWWLVPESARWLVSSGRYDEANKIMCKAARINGSYMPDKWWKDLDNSNGSVTEKKTSNSSFGVYDLVRTPVMRKRTLVCFFVWPVCTMMYYGLTMKSDLGGGNLYINFALSGAIEIPAMFIVYFLIDRLGRKPLASSCLLIAGISMVLTWVLGNRVPSYVIAITVTSAKCAVTTAYTVMYAYTGELFPTVLRNSAVGCCSMIARFGAISASFIAFYLVDKLGPLAMVAPFAILALTAAVAVQTLLPETTGKPMPESISEVEGHHI